MSTEFVYELLEPFEIYSQKALKVLDKQDVYIPTSQCFRSRDGRIWIKSWICSRSGLKTGKAFSGGHLVNLLEFLEQEVTHVPAYIEPVFNQEAADDLKA